MKFFINNCMNANYIDNYCFNIYSIAFIDNISQPYVLDYLKYEGLPKKLDSTNKKKMIKQLINPTAYKNELLIDNIKNRFKI